MSTPKEWALFLSGKFGFGIVPLIPGQKHPLIDGWQDAASRDPDQVSSWWDQWPDANIGAVMGKKSGGIRCIDCDNDDNTGADGVGVLRKWENENGRLPDTWQDLTGRGGVHIYFHSDKDIPNNNRTLHDDIEIRSEGLLVVLPPSLHPNGRHYQWETGFAPWEIPIAEADDTLLKFVMPPEEKKEKLVLPLKIEQGCREWTLYRAACSLQGIGFCDDAVEAAIREENEKACSPPLQEKEIKQLLKSAMKKTKGRRLNSWLETGKEMQVWILSELSEQLNL